MREPGIEPLNDSNPVWGSGWDEEIEPLFNRPRLRSQVVLTHGPIRCEIETYEALPSAAWSWIGPLSEAINECAERITELEHHAESKRQAEYEAEIEFRRAKADDA
jgi:hypothetical protein